MTVLFEHDGYKLCFDNNVYVFEYPEDDDWHGDGRYAYGNRMDIVGWALRHHNSTNLTWPWKPHAKFVLEYYEHDVALIEMANL